jgi:hypothetical protein
MLRKPTCILFLSLLFSAVAVAQTARAPQAKVNIIIDRELIRFAPQEAAVELRLVVTDQAGTELYDSGLPTVATLDWPLRDSKGETVKGGLYLYTLTVKDAAGELAQQRGYLIVNRAGEADRIWVATGDKVGIGAGSEVSQLTIVGSREATVGGIELAGSAPRRGARGERGESPQRANADDSRGKATAPAVVNGTANQVVKFGGDGESLVDSTISEVGGFVGIGTNTPASSLDYKSSLAPFFTRDIGTTNFGTAQSALQLGVNNLGSRNAGVGPSLLFHAENSAGNKSFLGRVSGVWENPAAGAEAGALFFQVRANSGDVSALTEGMRITAAGRVGIGTTAPTALLELSRTSSSGERMLVTTFYGSGGVGPSIVGRKANGSPTAPSAVQSGNTLLLLGGDGYDPNGFLDVSSTAIVMKAAQNWGYLRRGGMITFETTSNDSYLRTERMRINHDGKVGIGTIATLSEQLHVAGDIRVGTSGTNGCVQRFDGNSIAGSCVSDLRFKRDITPFPNLLGKVAKLRPVNYYWRSSEFPQRQFGTTQAYGLIAQEVELVLPELVTEDEQGYKQVDYSKLPLLTLQAVKELKAENDALKQQHKAAIKSLKAENAALQQRNAELDARLTALEQLLGQWQGQAQPTKRQ